MIDDPTPRQDFLTGQLLIAMPSMGDPRFERSVILICTHDVDHAMGIIINKQLDEIAFSELLDQLDIEANEGAATAPVFFGGPVQTERGLVLHSLDYDSEQTVKLSDTLGLTATKEILVDIGSVSPTRAAPDNYLLLIGHSGWGPGQLESEISMNAWIHCDPDDEIVFGSARDDIWTRALSKLGVTSAMLSREWASTRRDDQPLN